MQKSMHHATNSLSVRTARKLKGTDKTNLIRSRLWSAGLRLKNLGLSQDAQGQDRRANASVIDDYTATRYHNELPTANEADRQRMLQELSEYIDYREQQEAKAKEEHFE